LPNVRSFSEALLYKYLGAVTYYTQLYEVLYPFVLRQIKNHQDSLDRENIRDLLDLLIIKSENDSDIGYTAIIQVCMEREVVKNDVWPKNDFVGQR